MCAKPISFRQFLANRSGSLALTAALALPAVVFGAGTAVDISRWYNLKAVAQAAADGAALATVREVSLAGTDDRRLSAAATQMAKAKLGEAGANAIIAAVATPQQGLLKVNISLSSASSFGKMLGITKAEIAVTATARLMGAQKICLLALEPTKTKTLEASKAAKVTAPECSFFINSKDAKALSVKDSAKLTAQSICTSGGVDGTSMNFSPSPKMDCPPTPDPLAGRAAPVAGGCDYTDRIVDTGTVVLKPGVYCNGLRITKSAIAKLDPGTYIMRAGKLSVEGDATIEGVDVGLYFQGNNAQFDFDKNTTVNLAAPTSGAMAGILFYEDRTVPVNAMHRIRSNNAHTLLGTIYLPRGRLYIDADRPISQKAAYTIIVANQIEMISGPELFLNANYGGTTVPVPGGLGLVPGSAKLVQ
jgi:Flp pilus assembly protein TadG